jgi:hypothetical protein
MEKIRLIGCGGHARSVADAFLGRFPDACLKFYDVNAEDGETILPSCVWGGIAHMRCII